METQTESPTETLDLYGEVFNRDVINNLDNILTYDEIRSMRENISETIMHLATLPDEHKPNVQFIANIRHYYYLLKAMEPLQKKHLPN